MERISIKPNLILTCRLYHLYIFNIYIYIYIYINEIRNYIYINEINKMISESKPILVGS